MSDNCVRHTLTRLLGRNFSLSANAYVGAVVNTSLGELPGPRMMYTETLEREKLGLSIFLFKQYLYTRYAVQIVLCNGNYSYVIHF